MTKGERVIAVSESIHDCIIDRYPQTPADRIRVIPRGIQPEDYHVDDSPPHLLHGCGSGRPSSPKPAGNSPDCSLVESLG